MASMLATAARVPLVTDAGRERLERWMKAMSFRDCNLRLERGGDLPGYGTVAGAGGVEKGNAIVEVPMKAFLSQETAARCSVIGPLLDKGRLTSWQTMCLHLLEERARGAKSYWYPYLALLPSEAELASLHPLLWPQSVRAEWLAGSPMLDRIEARLAMCREDYEALLSAGMNDVTEDSVQWAAATLLSRSFSLDLEGDGETSVVLVPWADMLNHSSSAGLESCLIYDDDKRAATLCAHKSYNEGEQVYDSYGPSLSGSQLFLDYGFVDEQNENYAVDLPATVLGPVRGSANEKLLEALGLPINGAVFSLLQEGVDETVLAWTRAATASQNDLVSSGWKEMDFKADLGRAASAMVYFSEPLSEENESEVLRRLILACEELSRKYPTTLEQDMAQLESELLPWSRKQVLRALVSEKKALRGAQSVLCELLGKLRSGTPVSSLY